MPSLTIQRCPFPLLQGFSSELSSLSHPSFVLFMIKRWPSLHLLMYLSAPPPSSFSSTHQSFPSQIHQRMRHSSSFAEQHLHLSFIMSHSMWCGTDCPEGWRGLGVLALTFYSGDQPLIPQYGGGTVVIGNCKFSSFVRQLPGTC